MKQKHAEAGGKRGLKGCRDWLPCYEVIRAVVVAARVGGVWTRGEEGRAAGARPGH